MKHDERNIKPLAIRGIIATVAKLADFLGKNPKKPSAKRIHKLRANARKLETTLTAFSDRQHPRHNRLLRNLDDVRKYAGRIRDMDVLTAHALTLPRDRERRCLVQLLESLGAERFKRASKLRGLIDSDGPKFRKRLRRYLIHLKQLRTSARKKDAGSEEVTLAAARAELLSSELQSPIRLSRKNLHGVRIKVKELSDLLEISNRRVDPLWKALKHARDAIGSWHDWEELTRIARSSIDHGRSCSLIQTIQKTNQSKYKFALTAAHQLRRDVAKASSASPS